MSSTVQVNPSHHSHRRANQTRIAFDTWSLASRFRNTGIYVYTRNLLAQFRNIAEQQAIEVMPFVSSDRLHDAIGLQSAAGFHPRHASLMGFDRVWRFGGACLSAFMS